MFKRWLLVLPGIALLAVAFNAAINLVQSEIWRYQTENFLEHWQTETRADPDYVINKQDWQVTLAGIDKALTKAPIAAELEVLRARVLESGFRAGWLAIDEPLMGPMELTAWQQAILSRPAWPYSWSNYALARSQRSLIDDQFEAALVRANQLGPWEQKVMENAMVMGRYYRCLLYTSPSPRDV
ncbi:hypothetical protein, partial [Endozoicomonas sp.]|uniref:hypothetical protein n=1 Tax=Endozoicomonas sp. TaxID=1892382 RepID=UPI00383B6B95